MFRGNSFIINTEHSTLLHHNVMRVIVAYCARFIMLTILTH